MKYQFLILSLVFQSFLSNGQVKQVLETEKAILEAFVKRDTQFIKNHIDDEFIRVHADGVIDNKKEFLKAYSFFTPDNMLSIQTTTEKTVDKGNLIIIVGRVQSNWMEGQNWLSSKNRYTDTYKKEGESWSLISSFLNDIGEDYFRIKDTSGIWNTIQKQYVLLDQSVEKKDLCAHLALKTQDFSTFDHNGNYGSAQFMRIRSKGLFNSIQDSIESNNKVENIEIAGDTVKATVLQIFSRRQAGGGKLRYFQTSARQRESWMLTREGWKLVFVDKVNPLSRIVDGIKTDPSKPVNWKDPAFER